MRRSSSLISTSTSSLDERRGVDGDEAGVTPVGGVERAQAHEPVDAALGLQQPVHVLALDGERGALEPRLVAVLQVVDLDLEAAALEPAQVHAQQHLGPVLGLGAAGAGVDGEDRAALVVLAAEEAELLAALQVGLEGGDAAHELLAGARRRRRRRTAPRARAPRWSRGRRTGPRARRSPRAGAWRGCTRRRPWRRAPGRPRSRGRACAPRAPRSALSAWGGQR